MSLAFWSAALPGRPSISTYYDALPVVQLMAVSYEHHTFSNAIYAGDLSHDLLKPQPGVLITLGTNLALRIWHLLVGLPLIIVVGLVAGVSFEIRAVLLPIPAVVLVPSYSSSSPTSSLSQPSGRRKRMALSASAKR